MSEEASVKVEPYTISEDMTDFDVRNVSLSFALSIKTENECVQSLLANARCIEDYLRGK